MASYSIVANVALVVVVVLLAIVWFKHMIIARQLHIAYNVGKIVQNECGKEFMENETGVFQLYESLREQMSQFDESAKYMNYLFTFSFVCLAILVSNILFHNSRKKTAYAYITACILYMMYSRGSFEALHGNPFPSNDFYISTPLPSDHTFKTLKSNTKVFLVQFAFVCFLAYVLVPLYTPDGEDPDDTYVISDNIREITPQMIQSLITLVLAIGFISIIVWKSYALNNDVLVQYDKYMASLQTLIEKLDVKGELSSNYFRKHESDPNITSKNMRTFASYLMHNKGNELKYLNAKASNKKTIDDLRLLMFDMRDNNSIGDAATSYSKWVVGYSILILLIVLYSLYHIAFKDPQYRHKTVTFMTLSVIMTAFILTWVGWLYQAML